MYSLAYEQEVSEAGGGHSFTQRSFSIEWSVLWTESSTQHFQVLRGGRIFILWWLGSLCCACEPKAEMGEFGRASKGNKKGKLREKHHSKSCDTVCSAVPFSAYFCSPSSFTAACDQRSQGRLLPVFVTKFIYWETDASSFTWEDLCFHPTTKTTV